MLGQGRDCTCSRYYSCYMPRIFVCRPRNSSLGRYLEKHGLQLEDLQCCSREERRARQKQLPDRQAVFVRLLRQRTGKDIRAEPLPRTLPSIPGLSLMQQDLASRKCAPAKLPEGSLGSCRGEFAARSTSHGASIVHLFQLKDTPSHGSAGALLSVPACAIQPVRCLMVQAQVW